MNKPIKLIFAAILALTVFQAPATAETVLKFASFVPAKYVLHKPVFMKLADDLAKATNGNVKIKIYPSGALGKGPVEQYQRAVRRIAEIYGGRAGTLGAWRLTRAVLTHLVATGAVAVGDDLIGSIAGGSLLSKVSRRFGEGVVNGALTARVGVAAMEVCRPLPFHRGTRPSVTRIGRRALSGLFGSGT